tara:strand:+ start:681 stop:1232 length:552 start_codon:yes stop_codon:yes gene_type:complete
MSQLKVNSIVPVGGLPSGSNGGIIQIKQAVKTDTVTTTSPLSSNVATGLSVTITPSSNANKILVQYNIFLGAGPDDNGVVVGTKLRRGTTDIFIGDTRNNAQRVTTYDHIPGEAADQSTVNCGCHSCTFLDSPATTSAVTYSVVMGVLNNGGSRFVVANGPSNSGDSFNGTPAASITVMEVTV